MTTIAVPTSTTAKLGRVATIGYHQPQAWQIVTRMVDEQGWPLVDIRYNRRSYLDEWSGSSLRRHSRSGALRRSHSCNATACLRHSPMLAKSSWSCYRAMASAH
jgi:hypothetical protein